jgi:hypothetical protein
LFESDRFRDVRWHSAGDDVECKTVAYGRGHLRSLVQHAVKMCYAVHNVLQTRFKLD